MIPDIGDGGPAFPVVAENGLGHVAPGMSLRDWFAGQALAGFAATLPEASEREMFKAEEFYEAIALGAYRAADAMLAARKAQP